MFALGRRERTLNSLFSHLTSSLSPHTIAACVMPFSYVVGCLSVAAATHRVTCPGGFQITASAWRGLLLLFSLWLVGPLYEAGRVTGKFVCDTCKRHSTYCLALRRHFCVSLVRAFLAHITRVAGATASRKCFV